MSNDEKLAPCAVVGATGIGLAITYAGTWGLRISWCQAKLRQPRLRRKSKVIAVPAWYVGVYRRWRVKKKQKEGENGHKREKDGS